MKKIKRFEPFFMDDSVEREYNEFMHNAQPVLRNNAIIKHRNNQRLREFIEDAKDDGY